MTTTHYVAGFMFDAQLLHVALIRKQKPAWQKGRLNGIGGKVEEGELRTAAMVREFHEETGYATTIREWKHFLTMQGDESKGEGWKVDFFVARGELDELRTMEEEQVEVVPLDAIFPNRLDMIENLPWLIPLALDCVEDGRPFFADVHYMPNNPVVGKKQYRAALLERLEHHVIA